MGIRYKFLLCYTQLAKRALSANMTLYKLKPKAHSIHGPPDFGNAGAIQASQGVSVQRCGVFDFPVR